MVFFAGRAWGRSFFSRAWDHDLKEMQNFFLAGTRGFVVKVMTISGATALTGGVRTAPPPLKTVQRHSGGGEFFRANFAKILSGGVPAAFRRHSGGIPVRRCLNSVSSRSQLKRFESE